MPAPIFEDREVAGRALGAALKRLDLNRPLVFALPRGGVPVAVQAAHALNAPMDLIMVRKIGLPGSEELAAASVVDGAQADLVLNEAIMAQAGLTTAAIEVLARDALHEIERRRRVYLGNRKPLSCKGRIVVLVDDGAATGAGMRAAIKAMRRRGPARLLVALPIAPRDTAEALKAQVDQLICLSTPEPFGAVGAHYRDFHQLTDAEVIHALRVTAGGRIREGAQP
jgi:putative phosphoribosyl transferase